MLEYELKDADDNTYSLNGTLVTTPLKKSWTQGADSFEYDNKIVERSFLPGSALIGEKRLRAREFTLFFNLADNTSTDFQSTLNTILMWANKTKYLVDVDNDMEINITVQDIHIEYDNGSIKHSSNNSFSFIALSPCWSALTDDSVNGTALADTIKAQAVTNSGFFITYPVITLVATIVTDDVQIYIDSTNTGIQIQDSAFGTAGNLTMIIDCEEGLVSINDLDRNANIVAGTGFFDIPIGADTINILSSEEITYTIEWKKRYFI